MYYVYILQSKKTGKCYKGLTDNIDRRVDQHFRGISKSTKAMLPLQLVHVEICNDRIEARSVEKFFKSGFGREIIQEIVNN